MIHIWLACVIMGWTHSTLPGTVSLRGYEIGIVATGDHYVDTNTYPFCVDQKYTPTTFKVRAVDYTGATWPWSNEVTLIREHDFDIDGNGTVGFSDFGVLIQTFMTTDPRMDADGDGVVKWSDYGYFVAAFQSRYLSRGEIVKP